MARSIAWYFVGSIAVSHSAGCAKDPPARNRYPLASRWFQSLLALEITTAQRPAKDPRGHSPPHSRDERCQPLVGSATDSRRTAQARVGQTTVAKYMARRRRPRSQGWKTFLRNHADGIASIDMFVVPTISFRLLYALLVLRHSRVKSIFRAAPNHQLEGL